MTLVLSHNLIDSGTYIKTNKVLVVYMECALNMDTPNIFKSNKFYQHMALRDRKEMQLKRKVQKSTPFAILKETFVFVLC